MSHIYIDKCRLCCQGFLRKSVTLRVTSSDKGAKTIVLKNKFLELKKIIYFNSWRISYDVITIT